MKSKKSKHFIIIGILVVVIGLIITISATQFNSVIPISSPPIDGIQCGEMEQLGYHIHAHLDIFVNGSKYTVPALIGITNNCYYWLHTHDESGVIHIESPVTKNFTFDQFLKIWESQNNSSEMINILNNNTKDFFLYVNGQQLSNTTFNNIIFHPHDEIAIIIDKPPAIIPSKYEFDPGL